MTEVFADTFYWVAFTNIRDTAHDGARAFMRTAPPRLILTTEEVLTEYLNYFAVWGPELRHTVTTNIHHMRASRTVRIVPQSMESFQAGLMLYLQAPRERIHNPWNFAQRYHLGLRQVGHVHLSVERQQMVLAQAEKLDVFHHHHLVVFTS
jgi:uncharacterized protein